MRTHQSTSSLRGRILDVGPYRVLFPVGIFFSIIGVLLWLLFQARLISFYPIGLHGDFMVGGFLLAFATGFLMTAIPRFTGSLPKKNWELAVAIGLQIIALGTFLVGSRALAHLVFSFDLIFLISFATRRFLTRQFNPPSTFLFVGIGLCSGLAGCLFFVISDFMGNSPRLENAARLLFYQIMMLSLVLGVGAKLVAALLGRAPSPLIQINSDQKKRTHNSELRRFIALATLFVFSILFELLFSSFIGRLLRAAVVSVIAFSVWEIHRLPQARGFLAWSLYTSATFVFLGSWVVGLFPALTTHGLHFLFIGGFGLMTLSIASRVTLAHGGYDLSIEQRSPAILGTAILLSAATLVRVSAGIFASFYNIAIWISASLWIAAASIWMVLFLPKIFPKLSMSSKGEENC